MQTQSTQDERTLAEVQGKLIASLLLGRIKTNQSAVWGNFPFRVRRIVKQMREHLGLSETEMLKESSRDMAHAVAAAIFDRMLEVDTDDSKARLAKLPVTTRVVAERVVCELTGMGSERGNRRWHEGLWGIKTRLEQVISTSISGITPLEIRESFDPVIHTLIDELYEGLYPAQ